MNSSKIEKEKEQSEFSNYEEEVSPPPGPQDPWRHLNKATDAKKN